jgi:hypothetical protein
MTFFLKKCPLKIRENVVMASLIQANISVSLEQTKVLLHIGSIVAKYEALKFFIKNTLRGIQVN